jgi:hypothetical protein
MLKTISKEIGNDLRLKLANKKISEYQLYTHDKICSRGTLKNILKGNSDNTLPMDKIIKIYKAIDEKEININTDSFKLFVSFSS